MSSIIRVSERASLALHTMALLAMCGDRTVSARQIAQTLDVSEAHLAKVLQRLAGVNLVKSTRGPKGGFKLGKSPEDVSLLEIYETIEGPYQPQVCRFDKPVCSGSSCLMGNLSEIENNIVDYLTNTTLGSFKNFHSFKKE